MVFTKAKRSKAGWALMSLVVGLLLATSHAPQPNQRRRGR